MNNRSQLEIAYVFNDQFKYLARTVFGNPTPYSYFKFLKRLFLQELCSEVVDLQNHSFGSICCSNPIPFSLRYTTVTFRLIHQIVRYISKFKNAFHKRLQCRVLFRCFGTESTSFINKSGESPFSHLYTSVIK